MPFRPHRKSLFIVGLLAVLVAGSAAEARAQSSRCPEVEITPPLGKIDRSKPLRFIAAAGDMSGDSLTYNWSVSVPAQIKKVGEEPDEVDIDLKDFSGGKITVSVEIGGLPDGCPKTAVYELDAPPASNEKGERDEESSDEEEEEEEAGATPTDEAGAPTVSVNCPVTVVEGTPLYFNVKVDGLALNTKPTFDWKVSPAAITSGQSTSTIKVETRGQGNQIIRAELSLGGLDLASLSCSTMVKAAPYSYKLDELMGALSSEEKETRLRRFFLRLRAGLEERAYIIAYGRKELAAAEGRRARKYLVEERGIDASRFVLLDGGRRGETAVELWVAQPGAPLPFSLSIID